VDLTTLMTVAGLFLSVVVGNAAIFGDSLFASISVPKSVETAGLDRPTAERLFAAHVAWYARVPSILPTPSVSTSSAPSLAMALAKPIQLQDVVYAVQTQLRSDVVSASGAIISTGNGKELTMLVVINNPPNPPVTLTLQQPDGDPKALIQRAARETMTTIAPYRVALSDLATVLDGQLDGIAMARQTATRGLGQPWDASVTGSTEIVLLHNLLAVLAIERGDAKTARDHFLLAHTTPGALSTAYALVSMNEAFMALTERNPKAAEVFYKQGLKRLGHAFHDILNGRLLVLQALIAWQGGNVAQAEKLLRQALDDADTEIEPHYYLAKILRDRGDEAGAQEQTTAAHVAARFDQHYSSLAHTILGIDVATGELDVRAFLPDQLATVQISKPPATPANVSLPSGATTGPAAAKPDAPPPAAASPPPAAPTVAPAQPATTR
jgi:hypothetical protein